MLENLENEVSKYSLLFFYTLDSTFNKQGAV